MAGLGDMLNTIALRSRITISNLQAINMGDGKHVELSWSVPDISSVKYFIVELWDINAKSWKPYDGFHGVLSSRDNSADLGPPQKIVIEVTLPDRIISFRVKSIGKEAGIESEWSETACEVKVTGSEYAETNQFFIKNGLLVQKGAGLNVLIEPGTAYLGGKRILITRDVSLRLPDDVNTTYAVYISSDGVIGYCPWDMDLFSANAIRLAKVVVDANGSTVVTDTRFLWSPDGLFVSHDTGDEFLQYHIEWNGYREINLKQWRIYRAVSAPDVEPSVEQFKPIAVVERDVYSYIDSTIIPGQAYYYRVIAVDWGDNESPAGPAAWLDVPVEDYTIPAIPSGFYGYGGGSAGDYYINLVWSHNIESNLIAYRIWYKTATMDDWQLLARVPKGINTYRHSNLPNGMVVQYCISAENKVKAQSPRSDSITVVAGDVSIPSKVEWAFINPISTDFLGYGEFGAQTCWIKLKWDPVTTNIDGSTILDLDHYRIYETSSDTPTLIAVVQANQLLEWTTNSAYAGNVYRFVITAVDKSLNESLPSAEKSIVAGGSVPEAPTNLSVVVSGNNEVTIEFDSVTKYTDGFNIELPGGLSGYIIYRAFDAFNLTEIARIPVQNPQPDRYTYQDKTVTSNATYYYAVAAYRGSAVSDKSEVVSVEAGDSIPPEAPTWISLTARLNGDMSIDNILVWATNQESDLKGTWIYVMRSDIGFYEPLQFVPKQESGEYKYVHSRILHNIGYTYQLRTEDESGNLSPARIRNISSNIAFKPSCPIVSAEGIFDETPGVILRWDEVTTNDEVTPTPVVALAGYRIYRTSQGQKYKLIADIASGSESYEYPDMELINGREYQYKVVAYNALGVESVPYIIESVIAGDTTVPPQPMVLLTPTFLPTSTEIVTINLSISCLQEVGYYKVYLSNDGIRWSAPQVVLYDADGSTYSYTVPYGSYTFYRVSAVSIPGTEGAYAEDFFHVVYNLDLTDIEASDISIRYEPTGNGFFDAIISWDYKPIGNEGDYFYCYNILSGTTATPIIVTSIRDINTRTTRITGIQGGTIQEFAVVAENRYGVKSTPHWIIGAPEDDTIPKAPAEIRASGKVLAIGVEWDAVTKNTDESDCIDLSHYILEIANNPEFNPVSRTLNIPSLVTNYVYDTADHNLWYFRVKAVDSFGKESEYAVSNGARSIDITDFVGGGIVPEAPIVETPLETGVEWQVDNAVTPNILFGDEPDVWIKLRWQQVEYADHYKIYISEDNDIFYQVGTVRDPGTSDTPLMVEFVAHNLFPRTIYYFKVTASNKFNDESPFSQVVSCLSSTVVRPIDAPTNFGVSIGKNLIAIHWDVNMSMSKVAGNVLERRETTDPHDAQNRVWSDWQTIYVGRGSYYIDTPLEYDKFYQYRVATCDSAGNISNYAPSDYEARDYQPGRVGNEDIAANAIHGNQIFANTINSINIAADAIEARHLKAGSITSDKIAARAIRAQNLDLTVGGYNRILNSAFGMNDFNGNLGLDWNISGSVAVIEEDELLPESTPYCLRLFKQYEISQPISVTQSIPVSDIAGKLLTLSYDKWTQNITGTQTKVRLVVVTPTGTEYLADDPIVGTTNGWQRTSVTFTMPNNVISVTLEITMYGTSTGTLKITRLQLEDGDLATQWNPNGDEVYGASGKVQINSSGIKVISGAIDVESAYGKVKINSNGITAIKTTDENGNPLKFAKLDGDGLTIRGGAFSISTAWEVDGSIPADISRVEITEEGIKSYKDGNQTLDIGSNGQVRIWNGELSLLPTPPNTGKLIINSDGLTAYKNELTKTVKIDSATGKLSLYGGDFEIKTSAEGLINQGLVLNQNGISAYNADSSRFFNLDILNHKLFLYGGGFDISTAPEGQLGDKVSIDGSGISIYNNIGEKIIQMSGTDIPGEGVKMLLSGGFKIKSSSLNSSVIIDENGILGTFDDSSFELTRGHDDVTPGLHIRNGDITCGDVHIGAEGISVFGNAGIAIKSDDVDPITFVKMDHEGIKILEDGGIKIIGTTNPDSDGGSITFYPEGMLPGVQPTVAISGKYGIHANAITTGVLTIDGSFGDKRPRIEVKDGENLKVSIDKSGINIFDGAIGITGPDGNIYMENGQIVATGLRIGLGGSNLIRNGRGSKLNTYPWEGTAQITIELDKVIPGSSPEIKAGISGRTAFQFNGDTGDDFYQVVEDVAIGNKYTFSCWIYLISGSLAITIERPNSATPVETNIAEIIYDPSVNQQYSYLEYKHVIERLPVFEETDAPPVVRFTATQDGTYAFITDIMLTIGDMPSGFVNHANEIDACDSNVVIDDTGIKITNGKFTIQSILGDNEYNFVINGAGLSLTKADVQIFSLSEDGFGLNLPTKRVVINDSVGLKVSSAIDPANKYVALDENGLTIRGGFLDIESEDGSLKISPNAITVTDKARNIEKVRLDTNGLRITDGAVDIRSNEENASLQIVNDRIVVRNNEGRQIVTIGNLFGAPGASSPGEPIEKGLLIDGAGFKMTDTQHGGVVSISDKEIVISHPDTGTYSVLTASGLEVHGKDGQRLSTYASNVIVGGPIYSGTTVTLSPMKNPKVIIVPAHFQTFHAEVDYKDKHQYVKFDIQTGRDANGNFRFTPYVTYPIYNTPQTAVIWQSKGFGSYGYNAHAMGMTQYDTATQFGIYISYRGNSKTWHSDNAIGFTVKIWWTPKGSTEETLVLNTSRSSSSDGTSREWFWTQTYAPGTFRFDVHVTKRDDGVCYMSVDGISYYADTDVPGSKESPMVYYLVIDGGVTT